MKYSELRQKQQKEVDEFPFGFAFSNEQFKEMMEKFGLTENDTDKIYSIGAGGYIRKSDADAMHEMFTRHEKERQQAIENDKDSSGYIYEVFRYELDNHEYCITYDLEPTLRALGLTEEEVNKNPKLLKGLKKALKHYR